MLTPLKLKLNSRLYYWQHRTTGNFFLSQIFGQKIVSLQEVDKNLLINSTKLETKTKNFECEIERFHFGQQII